MLNMLRMLTQTAEQVLMALNGRRPLHLVNPEVWAKRRRKGEVGARALSP